MSVGCADWTQVLLRIVLICSVSCESSHCLLCTVGFPGRNTFHESRSCRSHVRPVRIVCDGVSSASAHHVVQEIIFKSWLYSSNLHCSRQFVVACARY